MRYIAIVVEFVDDLDRPNGVAKVLANAGGAVSRAWCGGELRYAGDTIASTYTREQVLSLLEAAWAAAWAVGSSDDRGNWLSGPASRRQLDTYDQAQVSP